MTVRIDPAAVVWSAPVDELPDRPLLVLMHGYASTEHDLPSLGRYLPERYVTASVRAPLAVPTGGFAWVPITQPGRPDPLVVQQGAEAVIAWLDASVPAATPVSLLGFSQGAVMVTQLLRTAPDRFVAGVALSGFVLDGSHPGDQAVARRRPPVFFGHGDADPIIAPEAFARTSAWLAAHATVTDITYPGLAHGISAAELADITAFLDTTALP